MTGRGCSAARPALLPHPPPRAAPAVGRKGRQKVPVWQQQRQQQWKQHDQKQRSHGGGGHLCFHSLTALFARSTHEHDSFPCLNKPAGFCLGVQAPPLFPCTLPLIHVEATSIRTADRHEDRGRQCATSTKMCLCAAAAAPRCSRTFPDHTCPCLPHLQTAVASR